MEHSSLTPVLQRTTHKFQHKFVEDWKGLKSVENEKAKKLLMLKTPISVHLCIQRHSGLNFLTGTRCLH